MALRICKHFQLFLFIILILLVRIFHISANVNLLVLLLVVSYTTKILAKATPQKISSLNKINIALKLNKNRQYLQKQIIPLRMINWYDRKHLEAKPWATSL